MICDDDGGGDGDDDDDDVPMETMTMMVRMRKRKRRNDIWMMSKTWFLLLQTWLPKSRVLHCLLEVLFCPNQLQAVCSLSRTLLQDVLSSNPL